MGKFAVILCTEKSRIFQKRLHGPSRRSEPADGPFDTIPPPARGVIYSSSALGRQVDGARRCDASPPLQRDVGPQASARRTGAGLRCDEAILSGEARAHLHPGQGAVPQRRVLAGAREVVPGTRRLRPGPPGRPGGFCKLYC